MIPEPFDKTSGTNWQPTRSDAKALNLKALTEIEADPLTEAPRAAESQTSLSENDFFRTNHAH